MRGLPAGSEQQALDIQRLAAQPSCEAGRGEQVVDRHRELQPLLRGIERLQIEGAHFVDRRFLDRGDQARHVETGALAPRVLEDRRQQHMIATVDRVRVAIQQRQQAGDDCGDPLAQRGSVLKQLRRRRCKRADDGQRQARFGAGRVDRKIDGVAKFSDALGRLPPLRQSVLPVLGCLRRVLLDAQALALRFARIDPREELGRFQVRKRQQQVAQVAFRIDADRRDAVDASLFEQRQAQAGFAAARHADADCVRGEIARVVEQQILGQRARRRLVFPPEIEHAEFFVVLHRPLPAKPALQDKLVRRRKVRFLGAAVPRKGGA